MVWTGAGILVVILGLAGVGTTAGLFALFGADLAAEENIFAPLGLIVGAVYTFLFHRFVLAKKEAPRELHDQKTGQKVVFKPSNSFMFIPFRHWPYVMAGIGLFTLIVGVNA